jgi:hypothetical protein
MADTHAHASEDHHQVGADMTSMLHFERADKCPGRGTMSVMRMRSLHRLTTTQAKHQSMQDMHREARAACTRAWACPSLSADRRPGVRMPDKYLHTRVRAECTAAGANNHYRMVASNKVDDTM